jgi:transcriptional regulator with XRE-family HTH domain
MDNNAFGKLVRTYRKQRGWSQGELADRWGFTRAYVSQVERGKRKLDKQEQVFRLADILGIPEERLEAVGKGIPRRVDAKKSLGGDDLLLQALLEPAQNTVKMSWLIWQGDGGIVDIEASLQDLVTRLDEVLELYNGQFVKPALRIQAYAHEMLGKFAIEHVRTKDALLHFQEMYDIAEELDDPNLLALALIHQAEMLRRQHRYQASFRRMDTAEQYIQVNADEVSKYIQAMFWKAYAITYFNYNDERGFLRAIDRATDMAEQAEDTIDALNAGVDTVEILQTRALGYTQLWKPEKALEIYQKTDTLRPFRPLRDLSSYHIIKAQAYCYMGDFTTGTDYAMKGMELAESLHSIRYVIRLQQMAERLNVTPLSKERALKRLQREVAGTLERMKGL